MHFPGIITAGVGVEFSKPHPTQTHIERNTIANLHSDVTYKIIYIYIYIYMYMFITL